MSKKSQQPQQVVISSSSSKGSTSNTNLLMEGSRSIKQEICPASIEYTSEYEIKVENNYARSFVLSGYPARTSFGWLDDLYSYKTDYDTGKLGDMDVAIHIEPSNERSALSELTEKITQYEAQRDTELQKGSIKNLSLLESKIRILYAQRERLEQNYESMFHISVLATMYNKDIDALNKNTQKLQSRINGTKMNIMPLYLRQDEGFKSVSPFGLLSIPDYYRNVNTGALCSLFPFYDAEVNHRSGTFIGLNAKGLNPIIVDFFNRKRLGNSNLCIFGTSGAGKSYLTSLIVLRSTAEGVRTVIIDPESEYGRCTNAVHGISLIIAPKTNSELETNMLNPFDIDKEYEVDENGNQIGEAFVNIKSKVSELLNLFNVMFPNEITSEMRSDISKVLVQLYYDFGITEKVNSLYVERSEFNEETGEYYYKNSIRTMPTMSDFRNALIRYNEVEQSPSLYSMIKSLELFCKGGIYDMFDCYTNVDFDELAKAPVIRFDISGIEDTVLRPIGMHIVLNWAENKFMKKDLKTKKRIVVDEAWMMLQKSMAGSDYSALFLETCARRIRKYNGSLCCASQNFREFTARPEGLSILTNSAVKIFLRQNAEDIEAVGSHFILSEGEKGFIMSAQQGEILVKIKNESFKASVYAFDFEDKLISKTYLKDNK